MKKWLFLCWATILLAFLSQMMLAQGKSTCLLPVDSIIKEREPTWNLVKKRLSQKGSYSYYQWRVKNSLFSITAWNYSSIEVAHNEFTNLPALLKETGLNLKVAARTSLFGDEGYFWRTKDGQHSQKGVTFRDKNLVFHVSASSRSSAIKLARYVQEFCPS
jgi:hypothetical protein